LLLPRRTLDKSFGSIPPAPPPLVIRSISDCNGCAPPPNPAAPLPSSPNPGVGG